MFSSSKITVEGIQLVQSKSNRIIRIHFLHKKPSSVTRKDQVISESILCFSLGSWRCYFIYFIFWRLL